MDAAFTPVDAPLLFRAPPGWRWRSIVPDYWNCWCVLDGACVVRVAGRSIQAGPGTCLVLPPGSRIEADHDQRRPAVNLAVHGRFIDHAGRVVSPREAPPLHVVLADPLRLSRLAEDCLAAWGADGRHGRDEYTALAQALLARIRGQAADRHGPVDRAITDLLLEVRRRPAQAWTVAACAARLGISRSQLTRRFQAACGEAPATLLARLRDEYALRLVQESDLPLAEVAALAGYVDASHLGRRLRGRTGMAPGGLRQR